MKTIQITNTYSGDVLDIVKSCVPAGFAVRTLKENSTEALAECIGDADYLLASGRVGINAAVLSRAPQLKMIQRTGVGLDSLDLDAIRQHGLPLYVNRGINARSVAEHALLLILACLRRLPQIDRNVKNGIWQKQAQGIKTRELCGKTVGIVGMGNIGRTLAELLCPFHVHIVYYDSYRLTEEAEAQLNASYVSLDELYAVSDIISLHCPLTEDSRKMICSSSLEKMKKGAVIVNTARGGLISEHDLADAVACGMIGAAGLDVYEKEPIAADSRLLHMEQVITTPHIGGVTYDSFFAMMKAAMDNIQAFDEGRLDDIADSRYL